MDILGNFYQNEILRETVKAFLHEHLKEIAVDKVFAGKDVKGILEARELVDAAFEKLRETYEVVRATEPQSNR